MVKYVKSIFARIGWKTGLLVAVALATLAFFAPNLKSVGNADEGTVCSPTFTSPVFNAYPVSYNHPNGAPCHEFPAVQARKVVGGNFPNSQSAWAAGTTAAAGEEVLVQSWIHNSAAPDTGSKMTNVQVQTTVDTSVGGSHTVTVRFTADNAPTFSQSYQIHTGPNDKLEVIEGSGVLYDFQGNVEQTGLTVGNETVSLGNMKACFEFAQFLSFKVKVVPGQVYQTPYGTPYSTPYGTPYSTPYGTPYSTPYGSPYATPYQTPYNTPYATPETPKGCVDIVKETFKSNGDPLTPVAQFTFKLDGSQTVQNDSAGRARFNNVPAGQRTVSEVVPAGWTLTSATPANGAVNVTSGSACVTVVFKNKQNPVYSTPYSSPYGTPYSTPYHTPYQTPYSTPHYGTPYSSPYSTPHYGTPYHSPYGTPYHTPYGTPSSDRGRLTIEKEVENLTDRTGLRDSVNADTGDRVRFEIEIRNPSDDDVRNVRFSDSWNAGLDLDEDSIRVDGDRRGSSLNINLGTLDDGDRARVTFEARVTANKAATIRNTACVRGDRVNEICDDARILVSQVLGTPNLVFSKRAHNDTQGRDATTQPANREDFITYTLIVTNTGSDEAENFVITDDLSGVLPFADMIDNGGGGLSGNTISYSAIDIGAGHSVTKTFRVRIKFHLAAHQSFLLTNTYGNIINITVPGKTIFVAPKTGSDFINLVAFAGFLTAGYAAFRGRRKIMSFILA